jgi:alkanesulfonate monooxygenase SsuD/methylene tetrahydromethanopterin reductase-like flavin-dependent oxidoreductase (luciferase family)
VGFASFQVAIEFLGARQGGRMAKYGRPPEALKIMPGLNAIVGRTAKEADEKHRYLQSLIHPDVGLELLSNALGGFDLSEYDIDGRLPDIPDHWGVVTGQTSLRNVVGWARENDRLRRSAAGV